MDGRIDGFREPNMIRYFEAKCVLFENCTNIQFVPDFT